jgi:hypothetical protein
MPFLINQHKIIVMKFDYNSDNYNEYEGEDMLQAAIDRRKNGRLKQVDINTFYDGMKSCFDVASNFDNPEENVLIDFIHSNPEQIENLKAYIESQGYAPATALVDLCLQVAHARNEQINDVVDKYDSDNFSFATAAGKERRRKRREKRRGLSPVDDIPPTEANQQASGKIIIDDPMTAYQANGLPPQGTNIAADEAHAELLGQESEFEEYDGEQDEFLPVLTAAIALGSKTISAVKDAKAKGQKINLKNFAMLFKKKAQEVADKAVEDISTQKKKDFLHENMPIIIVGVLGLIFVGSQLK